MLLKLALITAAAGVMIQTALNEEGTLVEKLAYVARALTGATNVQLRHKARHQAFGFGLFA